MSQEEQKVERPKTAQKGKKGQINFDFSTTTDLFISTKGRELRNKQKKLDKILQTEKSIKKGELQPNDSQKEMVANKAVLQEEIKLVKELVELYIQSNPNYARTEPAAPLKPVLTVQAQIEHAFYLMAQIRLVTASQEHCKLSDKDAAPLAAMVEKLNSLSAAPCKKEWEAQAKSFAAEMTNLA